jgi:hypothetical protein
MRFDPHSLQMLECAGWSEHELRATTDHLSSLDDTPGKGSTSFWLFPTSKGRRVPEHAPEPAVTLVPEVVEEKITSLGEASRIRLDEAARHATDDHLHVHEVTRVGDAVLIESRIDGEPLVVELRPASSAAAHFLIAGTALVSYRGQASETSLAILKRFASRLPVTLSRLVSGDAFEHRSLPIA